MWWNPGDAVTLRYVGHSNLQVRDQPGLLQGWPYRVVQDSADLLALWMPVGTHMKLIDMGQWNRDIPDLVHGQHPRDEFRRGEVLRLMIPGRYCSVWFHWAPNEGRRFLGWYVNLEAPFVRTPVGFDTTDDSLDVEVTPEFGWQWKDTQLADAWIGMGVYTRDETDGFFETGRAVIADVEARRFPFDGSWLDWRPPADWTVPEATPGWDRISGYDVPLSTGRRLKNVDHPSVA